MSLCWNECSCGRRGKSWSECGSGQRCRCWRGRWSESSCGQRSWRRRKSGCMSWNWRKGRGWQGCRGQGWSGCWRISRCRCVSRRRREGRCGRRCGSRRSFDIYVFRLYPLSMTQPTGRQPEISRDTIEVFIASHNVIICVLSLGSLRRLCAAVSERCIARESSIPTRTTPAFYIVS